jgi:hypothetical protein
MDVTMRLGDPSYYAINAQLRGGRSVSCTIKGERETIATGPASGGFQITSCGFSPTRVSG